MLGRIWGHWKKLLWVAAAALVIKGIIVLAVFTGALHSQRDPILAAAPDTKVRPPQADGGFYPADPDRLHSQVEGCLAHAEPPELDGRLVALIVPHAGYDFSGPTAGYAFKLLAGQQYDSIIVIGPSHQWPFPGGALTESDFWETPLGNVAVDRELCDSLLAISKRFRCDDMVQRGEHSIEVELPFLQVVLDELKFCPIEVRDASQMNCDAIADALAQAVGERQVLLVASSDMAHYPATDITAEVDAQTLDVIKEMDPQRLSEWEVEALEKGTPGLHCTLCGLGPVRIVMRAAIRLGADTAQVLFYTNSGRVDLRTAGQSVGYCAVALVDTGPDERAASLDEAGLDEEISLDDQRRLLEIARASLESYTRRRQIPDVTADSPALRCPRAIFVTLNLKDSGALRGCIGSFEPHHSLATAVNLGAIAAGFQDPRFPGVTAAELDNIEISISILSPMRRIRDASEIELGTHGIVVCQGQKQGIFLPEVAPEQGWDLEATLR